MKKQNFIISNKEAQIAALKARVPITELESGSAKILAEQELQI